MAGDPTTLITTCPLDCPDTCTLAVEVVDGLVARAGAAPVGVGNPFTGGWICAKVRRHARRSESADRVRTPLLRTGPKGSGSFTPITWDEALERAAAMIGDAVEQHGPASVVPFLYNSSAGAAAAGGLTVRLFRELGTSEVAHTICAATAANAWHTVFPDMLSADVVDVAHSDLVVVWGANPSVSNPHLTPLLVDARSRGAAVVVIDPRRTSAAARADLHLAVRPGTDAALALGVAAALEGAGLVDRSFCDAHASGVDEYLDAARAWTLDRTAAVCGVDPAAVLRLAELVGTRRPGMLRVGWGMERNRNGGAGVRAALSLWVLAGQFGRPGAGVLQSTSGASPVGFRWPGTPARTLNMNHLGRDLLAADPPVRVLFVQGANPAVMAPHQGAVLAGLAREDLGCIVHEQLLTDTARFADLVLPATTFVEAVDVAASYGTFTVGPVPAVARRAVDARTNDELAAALAGRLGLSDYDPERVLDGVDVTTTTSTRPQGTVQFGPPGHRATTRPEGGRAHLVATRGDRVPTHRHTGPPPDVDRLVLLTPAAARTVNSIFGEAGAGPVTVTLHPADAAARGIGDGDPVVVRNERGSIRLVARLSDEVRPGVAATTKGRWLRDGSDGRTVNVLTPDDVEHTVGGACFNDTYVEVLPASADADAPGPTGA
jgi:anaerobic selenocysteine-containing dehydrogenase